MDAGNPQKTKTVFLTALLMDDELITTLTGKPAQNREEAILEGYNLVVQ